MYTKFQDLSLGLTFDVLLSQLIYILQFLVVWNVQLFGGKRSVNVTWKHRGVPFAWRLYKNWQLATNPQTVSGK